MSDGFCCGKTCCSTADSTNEIEGKPYKDITLPCAMCVHDLGGDLGGMSSPKVAAGLENGNGCSASASLEISTIDAQLPEEVFVDPNRLDTMARLNSMCAEGPVAAPLEGAWEELQGDRKIHIIKNSTLRWSNGLESLIEVDGKTLTLKLIGTPASAKLDSGKSQLEWDDGDAWSRATLNGSWLGGGGCHIIRGAELITKVKNRQAAKHTLSLVGSRSLSVIVDTITHLAMVDPSGMRLHWLDGDVWMRRGASQSEITS